MTKQEFLEKLRAALGNDLSGAVVSENVNYYKQYITDEVAKGKSEKEVIDELGDPWAIAPYDHRCTGEPGVHRR